MFEQRQLGLKDTVEEIKGYAKLGYKPTPEEFDALKKLGFNPPPPVPRIPSAKSAPDKETGKSPEENKKILERNKRLRAELKAEDEAAAKHRTWREAGLANRAAEERAALENLRQQQAARDAAMRPSPVSAEELAAIANRPIPTAAEVQSVLPKGRPPVRSLPPALERPALARVPTGRAGAALNMLGTLALMEAGSGAFDAYTSGPEGRLAKYMSRHAPAGVGPLQQGANEMPGQYMRRVGPYLNNPDLSLDEINQRLRARQVLEANQRPDWYRRPNESLEEWSTRVAPYISSVGEAFGKARERARQRLRGLRPNRLRLPPYQPK